MKKLITIWTLLATCAISHAAPSGELKSFIKRFNNQVFNSSYNSCALSLSFTGNNLTLKNVLPRSINECSEHWENCDGSPRAYNCLQQLATDGYFVKYTECVTQSGDVIGLYPDGRVSGFHVEWNEDQTEGRITGGTTYFFPSGSTHYRYCPKYKE